MNLTARIGESRKTDASYRRRFGGEMAGDNWSGLPPPWRHPCA